MLPFLSLPEPAVFKNNRSSLTHADFLEEAIRELVESGRVVEANVPPLVVNSLSVSVQANGKKRLILVLRYVNKFLRKMHIKYEDWKTAMSYFTQGAYMFSFDLKSGYHHIEIFPRDIKLILVFLGSIQVPIVRSLMCSRFYLSDCHQPLTFSRKLLNL